MDPYILEKVFNALILIYIFFMGTCTFSFLNVVIYRVPNKISFLKGRSFCPKCSHQLSFKDMFPPVFSWVFLKGKCRYCGEPVSPRYAMVEALGGVLALICALKFGYNMEALTVFIFFCVLTVVAFVDIDTMEIPNGFVVASLVVGVLKIASTVIAGGDAGILSAVIGMFCVSVPMLVLAIVIPGAFGGGDIKLMFACGLFLGWKLTVLSTALGILTGGLYGIYLLASKKIGLKEHFAFGPFLCIGMLVSVLCGQSIINWYIGFFQY